MRRNRIVFSTKALSPYSQALKHVALRGAAAFGPTAREQERMMYRAGSLPADYRPPVQGKWDDTIERWAYAWQFPTSEEALHEDTLQSLVKSPDLIQLVSFARKLTTTPPSKMPGSAKDENSQFRNALPIPVETPKLPSTSSATEEGKDFFEALEKQVAQVVALEESDTQSSTMIMPAEEYSKQSGVPVAYLDDGSQLSAASKEICLILQNSFSLSFEESSIALVIRALASTGYFEEGRTLLSFARDVGLGPTSEMYRSLMHRFTSKGEVNESMALIEEMKEEGITPTVGNWHELMLCFHQAKDYPAVRQVVDHMKAYANIEPNEVTFAIQLRALAKDQTQLSSIHEAIQLFDQMENVYGFIASRPHYHAMMASLSQSPLPEMRLRCQELGKKMELMGIVWDEKTFLYQIMSAQVVGDLKLVESLFGKMRNEGIGMTQSHLTWAIHGHTEALLRLDFVGMKERQEDPIPRMLSIVETCFDIQQLILQRGWRIERQVVNALLRLCCQSTMLAMDHCPQDAQATGKFEAQATLLWTTTFDELAHQKDVFSYENYIALLAHQQRLDEAEKCFQELCLREDKTPSRRTYEALIFMHLASGEEGGTARALHYLEAMERAKIPIRPQLIKKIVKVNNAAGFKRDMKRRARRIIQMREEYMARKAEGVDMTPKPYEPPQRDADGNLIMVPLPVAENSAVAWWDRWKRSTTSKHELFDAENSDGTPKGQLFAEKNEALTKMGITSPFSQPSDLPDVSRHQLLPKMRREEGEVTGALWGLDGGELSYPRDGNGPNGWGVRLWRENQIIKKEFQKTVDGKAPTFSLSEAGNSLRTIPNQALIQSSGAATQGELSDASEFSDLRYDDGKAKPMSEFAVDVPRSAELVWQQEAKDRLAPYKTDEELSLEADNIFNATLASERESNINKTIQALQLRQEGNTDVAGSGVTRRSKFDYLEKWREMYRHGTLEVPDEPLQRLGTTPTDHKDTLSRTVRSWFERNKRKPTTEDQAEKWVKDEERAKEQRTAAQALARSKRLRKRSGRK